MKSIDRRRFLGRLGGGAAFTLGAAGAGPWSLFAADAGPARPARLQHLAGLFRETPRERALQVAVDELHRGASDRDILGGVFLAGIHDVEPRPVGFKLHAVLMVSSVLELSRAAAPAERLYPILFNLDDFKRAQRRDREGGDWVLPPPPPASFSGVDEAGDALRGAMRDWDEAAADRAATWLAPRVPQDDLFELLWPAGGRDYRDLGHKIIFCSQVYRAIRMIGWENGAPAVRSLLRGLLSGGPGEKSAPHDHNLQAAAAIEPGWRDGRPAPEASRDVLRRLRTCSWKQASDLVVEMLERRVAAGSIWDGIRVAASELLLRQPGLLPVHPVTATNAFHQAYLFTGDDHTRRLMLLQAASWIPLFRDELLRRLRGYSMEGRGLDELRAEPPAAGAFPTSPGQALAEASSAEGARRMIRAARRFVCLKGSESHHYKYSAAIFEDYALTGEAWAPHVLAAGIEYLPSGDSPDSDVVVRARRALASRG